MRTIHKYDLPVNDSVVLQLPEGCEILNVLKQSGPSGIVQLWAIVDTEAPQVPHKFIVRGTGHPLPLECAKATHIATVMDGPFVWHVFRKIG